MRTNRDATPALPNESGKCNETWRIISDNNGESRNLVVAGSVPVLRQGQQPGCLFCVQGKA